MGQARDVLDRLNAAVATTKDVKAAAECYAVDAVAMTPDQGEVRGRERIADYLRQFMDAFPDAHFEFVDQHESKNVAIDESYFIGTHTGPLAAASGDRIPATGRSVRVRECDVVVVEGGQIVQHRFYFDQIEFLSQLGQLSDSPS